jgi:hypothetical protein
VRAGRSRDFGPTDRQRVLVGDVFDEVTARNSSRIAVVDLDQRERIVVCEKPVVVGQFFAFLGAAKDFQNTSHTDAPRIGAVGMPY